MASKISVNLDTSKENYLVAKCKQNDDLRLEVFIYENGLALDLTNKEISIQALKSDRSYIIQSTGITKENNKISVDLSRDFSRVTGTTKIEVVLIESGKQNTTFSFYLEVVASVINGAIESLNTVTILEQLGNKVVEAGVAKAETERLIATGNAATKGDIATVNTQLEQINNEESNNRYKTIKQNTQSAMAVFIDDDGSKQVYTKLFPLIKEKNIPYAIALITNNIGNDTSINKEQVIEMYNYGVEICSHTLDHTHLAEVSLTEAERQLRDSKKAIENLGIKCEHMVYPYGNVNKQVKELTSKYYKSGFVTGGYPQSMPLPSYYINRFMLGSYFAQENGRELNTFEDVKRFIDFAITNKRMIVFCTHSQATNDEQWNIIRQVIDYLNTTNVPIVSLSKAFETYGNICEYGDLGTGDYVAVGRDGKLYSNTLTKPYDIKNKAITNSTPITDFESGKSTVSSYLYGDNTGLPDGGAGTLLTYKPLENKDLGLAYQEFNPYSKKWFYRRYWNITSSVWDIWVKYTPATTNYIIMDTQDSKTNSSSITVFSQGITYTPIFSAFGATAGFPSTVGMLITHNMSSEKGFQWQEWKKYATNDIYIRHLDTNGNWGSWRLQTTSTPS